MIKSKFKLTSVKQRIIAGFLFVIFINLIIFLTLEISNTYSKLKESALDKSSAYAEHIEKIISPIGIQNNEKIQKEISTLLKNQYNAVEYIGVLDDNLKYVANTDTSKIGTYFKNSNVNNLIQKNTSNSFVLKTNGKNGYFSAVPLYSTESSEATDTVSSATEESKNGQKLDNVSSATTKVNIPGLIIVKMDNDALLADFKKQILKLIVISSVILILSILTAFVISLGITNPLKKIQQQLNSISKGDLTNTVEINSKDEMGDLARNINITSSILKNVISKIIFSSKEIEDYSLKLKYSTGNVNTASDEITSSIQEINDTSVAQNTNLKDFYGKFNNSSVELNTIDSKISYIENIIIEIKNIIGNQKTSVKRLGDSLDEIGGSFSNLKTTIFNLSDKVKNINSISMTIAEVAKQTNLLSLNASIEAARASKSDSGFTVVASEIKKLSQETMDYSGKIKKLTEDIYDGTKLVSKTTFSSIDTFNDQSKAISSAMEVFESLVNEIDSIAPKIHEISDTTKNFVSINKILSKNIEYTTSSQNQLSASIENVSQSMEEQSTNISNLSDLSNNLHKVSNDMISLINVFKI